MTSTTRIQRKYDHRLRELVRSTGDAEYAIQRGVPRSTARGWLRSTRAEVVTVDVVDMDTLRLQQEVLRLQKRIDRFVVLLRLLIVVLKVSRVSLASCPYRKLHPIQLLVITRHFHRGFRRGLLLFL